MSRPPARGYVFVSHSARARRGACTMNFTRKVPRVCRTKEKSVKQRFHPSRYLPKCTEFQPRLDDVQNLSYVLFIKRYAPDDLVTESFRTAFLTSLPNSGMLHMLLHFRVQVPPMRSHVHFQLCRHDWEPTETQFRGSEFPKLVSAQ